MYNNYYYMPMDCTRHTWRFHLLVVLESISCITYYICDCERCSATSRILASSLQPYVVGYTWQGDIMNYDGCSKKSLMMRSWTFGFWSQKQLNQWWYFFNCRWIERSQRLWGFWQDENLIELSHSISLADVQLTFHG